MSDPSIVHDEQIEWFLTNRIGCKFRFDPQVALDRIERAANPQQIARLKERDADYVAGISETIRLGGPLRPVILAQISAKRFRALDGLHRVHCSREAGQTTIEAYIVEATPDEELMIAQTVNVVLNGQGLSEDERRHHFLTMLRAHNADLSEAMLREPYARIGASLLSLSTATAKKYLAIELFRARAARIGLKLPLSQTAGHLTGERGDQWILSVAGLTDEELIQHWDALKAVKYQQVAGVVRKLKACTSTAKRAALADELLRDLRPTVRRVSQKAADKERRAAGQILCAVGIVRKYSTDLRRLRLKYEDVHENLVELFNTVSNALFDDESEATNEERIAPQA